MDKKRLTAVKTRIRDLADGSFVQQEGFNPNYVVTSLGRVSRARVLGTVVDTFVSDTGKFASLTIDDGTDTIRVKIFTALSMMEGIAKGDTVDVVGRVKEYQDERYIMPEVIAKVPPEMEVLRELEIREREKDLARKRALVSEYRSQVADLDELTRMMRERFGMSEDDVEIALREGEQIGRERDDLKAKVLGIIATLDKGEGCEYADLIAAAQLDEDAVDSVVNELLEEGSCFEPRPGKIKKL